MPLQIHPAHLIVAATLSVAATIVCSGTRAMASSPNACDHAAATISQESDVPLSILKAISRTETGRMRNGSFQPWPWATNAAGKGQWFEGKMAAVEYARARITNGFTNVDIGCFQLNYRWHGHAFSSLEDMFDPETNARYAAEFLSRLHNEKGDWMRAVGAYHSRTQEYATRYKRRFAEIHASLGEHSPRSSQGVVKNSRPNRFPLLRRSGSTPRLGSLVPLAQSTSRGALWSKTGDI